MKTKILFIERKFWEFVSIEKVFRQIAANLSKEKYEFSFCQMPFGNGIKDIFKNLLFFRKSKADIFHITGHIHYISLVLPRNRTVLTIHDLGFLHTRKGLRRFFLKKLFLDFPVKKLKYITAISQTTKDEIIKFTDCDEKKIRLIENPVREFKNTEIHLFKTECPTILQIGTMSNKNLPNLISALKGIDCKLRIIGKLDEKMSSDLLQSGIDYSNSFDLDDDEMEQEYSKSDIIAFCSTYEGFGLPIIEGQKMRTPVITSNISPMKEVSGGAAFLADPFNVENIREGILKLIQDSEYRDNLVKKGVENAERFNQRKIAEQYENLYAEILTNN